MTDLAVRPDTEGVSRAMTAVADRSLSIEDRAALYAVLRSLRLQLDRVLRPVGREIQEAMARAGAERWGPLRLTWKPIDPRYDCNLPDNWGDDGVQEQLAAWAADSRYTAPDGTPWVRHIPSHYEVDTAALGAAMAAGDPAARELYRLIRDKGYRTEAGRAATITVDEPRRREEPS